MTLFHTGPLLRECPDVKSHLLTCYEKNKHKYSSNDVFHTNFKQSIKHVQTGLSIPKETYSFTCKINNKIVNVSNVYLESPCIFVGNHPLRGSCKLGVQKKHVVLNISPEYESMLIKKGFSQFVYKPESKWFASWIDDITKERKYLFLPTQNHEIEKFEHARALKKKLPMIRKQNLKLASDTKIKRIQLGIVVFFIEHLCIRVGHEKEYDTIGACTMTTNNVHLCPNSKVHITFIGKDGIPFDKLIQVNNIYYKGLQSCFQYAYERNTTLLFSLINPSIVNRYLSAFHPNISAKVFRTCKASVLFQKEYRKHQKKHIALKNVALLLNHKKMNPKTKQYVLNTSTSWNNYIDHRIIQTPGFCF